MERKYQWELGIMALGILALGIMALGIMALGILALGIMVLGIMVLGKLPCNLYFQKATKFTKKIQPHVFEFSTATKYLNASKVKTENRLEIPRKRPKLTPHFQRVYDR